jgi:isopentenyl-diphosphate delta-isomerase type 1
VVGYSGVKADTVQIIKEVAQKKEMYPEKITKLFGAIATLVSQAKEKMIEGDFESVGKYMNYNHEYLRDLGVSSEKLENLIFAAKKAGAWGAKISGAGGGDCMIALVSNENADNVRHAITQSGGELVNVGVNADGVRLETTDDQAEQFVVVDSHDTFKEFRSRYDCHHNKQLIHRGVGLLIFDDKKRVLLQKRSKTKDTRPEYWSTSVGGHVQKDESYESAAMREAKEELGIAIPISFHSKQVNAYENETEMNAVFTATYNGPFQVNTEEVEEVRFFDRNELERLMKEKTFLLSEAARNDLSAVGYI